MGKWYVLWRTRYSRDPDALVLELLPGEDDHVIAKFTGLRYNQAAPILFTSVKLHERWVHEFLVPMYPAKA